MLLRIRQPVISPICRFVNNVLARSSETQIRDVYQSRCHKKHLQRKVILSTYVLGCYLCFYRLLYLNDLVLIRESWNSRSNITWIASWNYINTNSVPVEVVSLQTHCFNSLTEGHKWFIYDLRHLQRLPGVPSTPRTASRSKARLFETDWLFIK